MESDMKGLKRETSTSRARIRDLELELENARIATLRAERDAEVYKDQRNGLEDEVERLKDEKAGEFSVRIGPGTCRAFAHFLEPGLMPV
jgi:hypothetical protein